MDTLSKVVCPVCARGCVIPFGKAGACGKYVLTKDGLAETAPGRFLIVCGISIETMPVLHFYPKAKFLQITTTGCNFQCDGCVSTSFVRELSSDTSALTCYSAEALIEKAREESCEGITFVMNDPLASYFTFLDIARKAHAAGLLVGCSTNGYFTKTSAEQLASCVDFMNIGLKGFDDESYRACGVPGISPVLKSVAFLSKEGVHIEISCMFKKNQEDNLADLAMWLAFLDSDIPLQIMRFMPLESVPADEEPSIAESEELCRDLNRILPYVFLFNSPGTTLLDTRCPECGSVLISRDFYGPMGAKVRSSVLTAGKCPCCGHPIPIQGIKSRDSFKEQGFMGGYPFTRALEMIEAILIALGITEEKDVLNVWESVLSSGGLENFHKEIQNIPGYFSSIQKFGSIAGRETEAERLIRYMKSFTVQIQEKLGSTTKKPRVYYAMGKPLFCFNGGRFENQLIEWAGGVSVNKELDLDGRPGETISAETLNRLNPDIIFVSSFLSNSLETVYKECQEAGVTCKAVCGRQIYKPPYPNIDFGSPRWILGLLNAANVLHPELFNFDIEKEASSFYRTFYHCDFVPGDLNLSFAKPSCRWQWEKKETDSVSFEMSSCKAPAAALI